MPISTSTYRAYDQDNGAFITPAIPQIIDVVALSGLRLTSASNIITVTSTLGLFPGMSLFLPHVPMGAFIHAVMSDTQIVAYGMTRDAATGVYTVSAAAANATADVTTGNLTGHARGFNEFGIVTDQTDGTVYRNEIGSTGAGWSGWKAVNNSSAVPGETAKGASIAVAGQAGIVVVPAQLEVKALGQTGTENSVSVAATTMAPQVSDSIAKVPPRPQTRWVHEYVLVASCGAVTRIRKSPNVQIVRTGASA
jgi:hypothetical protein